MAESSTGTSSSTGDPLADFGANEWLVDEMYQRYQRDPNSVDKVWWDFFGKDQRASGSTSSSTAAAPSSSNGSSSNGSSSNGAVKESTGAPKSRPSNGTAKNEPKKKHGLHLFGSRS